MDIHNSVQEAGIKTIPKEKKCKKTKWLSEEALQIAVKRREVKGIGEKERYTHLNVEFQRIARRDKKAFFSDQCKEIKENHRMRKTRHLFKKIRDTKGTFPAGSRRETFHSWQRSWGRGPGIRKGGIEPRECPRIFSSIYPPKNQSLPTLLLCALTSDFTGGYSPPPSHSLCQRVNLQLQLIKFLGN